MGSLGPLRGQRALQQVIAVSSRVSDVLRIAPTQQCVPYRFASLSRPCTATPSHRTMATIAGLPGSQTPTAIDSSELPMTVKTVKPLRTSEVLTTIYSFPTLEPLRFEYYPSNHLHLPLRRDLLHRAVIYEGDKTRQGTASTKWRSEIHGSKRKIRPQKGTGRARLGDKGSPMLRGGGVAFGPKPRDFSTDLPRKIYDLAWRTALSYRYQKGELFIMEDGVDIEYSRTSFVKQIFNRNHWGNPDGRSLIITSSPAENLSEALEPAGDIGRVLTEDDVDVKDLLGMGRLIVEKSALDGLLRAHESDLRQSASLARIDG